jgi:hypothetical protein
MFEINVKLIKKKQYKSRGEKLHGEEFYHLYNLLYCFDNGIGDFRMGTYGVRRGNTEKLHTHLTGKTFEEN